MTNTKHPITPSQELVQQWIKECDRPDNPRWQEYERHIATCAARWGADEQLEQDARWLDTHALFSAHLTVTPSGDALRQAMRSKPPSLKEQALKALYSASFQPGTDFRQIDPTRSAIIRRALEKLDD
jgi:hypothetical protein